MWIYNHNELNLKLSWAITRYWIDRIKIVVSMTWYQLSLDTNFVMTEESQKFVIQTITVNQEKENKRIKNTWSCQVVN